MIRKGLKFVLIKDSGENGGLVTCWDRFSFGCKTLKGGYLKWDRFRFGYKTLQGVF